MNSASAQPKPASIVPSDEPSTFCSPIVRLPAKLLSAFVAAVGPYCQRLRAPTLTSATLSAVTISDQLRRCVAPAR
jgi:hypothetical protein